MGIGAPLTISGSEVALKYCFPGCSFVPCSREYCSRVLRRYFFLPYISWKVSKNWPVCLPMSIMYDGGCLFSPPRGDAREHVSIIRGDRRRENAPEHLDDARDLIVLARAGEEREPEEELDGDAPERPHVDRGGVR